MYIVRLKEYTQCVQKVWKHLNKIETNDFPEKRKNR
jgi:hypothetical protein